MTAGSARSTRPGRRSAMLAWLAAAAVLSTPAAPSAQMELGPPRGQDLRLGAAPRPRPADLRRRPVPGVAPHAGATAVREHRRHADEAARRRARADCPALSRRRAQVVGTAARHLGRPRGHGLHDPRVRGAGADGRALPLRAAPGLAGDGLGRELPDPRRLDRPPWPRAFPVARTKATGPRGVTCRGGVGRRRLGGRLSSAATSRARRSSSTASSSRADAATRPAAAPGSSTPTPRPSPGARRWW